MSPSQLFFPSPAPNQPHLTLSTFCLQLQRIGTDPASQPIIRPAIEIQRALTKCASGPQPDFTALTQQLDRLKEDAAARRGGDEGDEGDEGLRRDTTPDTLVIMVEILCRQLRLAQQYWDQGLDGVEIQQRMEAARLRLTQEVLQQRATASASSPSSSATVPLHPRSIPATPQPPGAFFPSAPASPLPTHEERSCRHYSDANMALASRPPYRPDLRNHHHQRSRRSNDGSKSSKSSQMAGKARWSGDDDDDGEGRTAAEFLALMVKSVDELTCVGQ